MKLLRCLAVLCIGLAVTATSASAKARSIRLVNESEHRVVVAVSREDRKKFASWVLEAHGSRGASETADVDDKDGAVIFYIGTLGCVEQKFTLHPHQQTFPGFTIHKNCRIS